MPDAFRQNAVVSEQAIRIQADADGVRHESDLV